MQERRHGLRVSRTGRRFLVTVISLSAQQLENLSKVASDCMLWVATIGGPISESEVFKRRKPLLSVGECTTTGGVTVLNGDKGYMFHKGSNVAKEIDAWIQKELRDSQVASHQSCFLSVSCRCCTCTQLCNLDSESGGCRPGPNL